MSHKLLLINIRKQYGFQIKKMTTIFALRFGESCLFAEIYFKIVPFGAEIGFALKFWGYFLRCCEKKVFS